MRESRVGPRTARITLLVLAALAASAASPVTVRQTRIVTLPPGRALVIDITIGAVKIEGSDRADAELLIERQAPSTASLARIPVTIDETPERVTVRGVQAEGATNPELRVDLTVRVPRGAVFERIQVIEGRLSINQFSGQLTADVRRGPIEGTDLSGTLRLETGIGSVVLTRAKLSPDGLLRLRTFNGDIRLALAETPPDARILALALNGTIRSDIPLTKKDTWGPRWSETTLGRGEPVISLDVVTGTIEISCPKP
ncbi:MAG: hypothetical protein ABI665_20150 [Vicinamibacterales bacterium]